MTGPRDSTRTEPSTITVMVTFFADLRRFLPRGADGPQRYTVPKDATVDDLLTVIGVAPDAELTIALDGEQTDREAPLREGAEGYQGISWAPPADVQGLSDALIAASGRVGERFADPRSWSHTVEVYDDLFADLRP